MAKGKIEERIEVTGGEQAKQELDKVVCMNVTCSKMPNPQKTLDGGVRLEAPND